MECKSLIPSHLFQLLVIYLRIVLICLKHLILIKQMSLCFRVNKNKAFYLIQIYDIMKEESSTVISNKPELRDSLVMGYQMAQV